MLYFASDYQEGAHPKVLEALVRTNLEHTAGYGEDPYCQSAREKIRAACGCPEAAVYFLVGGTQTNATVIDALLRSYEGVVAAETGHIATHEAGAIELGGHKVLTLPEHDGKLDAGDLRAYLEVNRADGNRDHMVHPALVYLSQPTELGTLYSLGELTEIHRVCRDFGLRLYVDGARLSYALASKENDVTLGDLCRLTDVFYIGGTKCGALLGEAVVARDPKVLDHFFPIIKQHGALLAKGRVLGVQFDALFTGGLYESVGRSAVAAADRIRAALKKAGIPQAFVCSTNQVFPLLEDARAEALQREVAASFWEKPDPAHTILRLAASWATTEEDVAALERAIEELGVRS